MDALESYYESQVPQAFDKCKKTIFDISLQLGSLSEKQLKMLRVKVKSAASHEKDPLAKDLLELIRTHCDHRLERVHFWKMGGGKWCVWMQLVTWDDPLKIRLQVKTLDQVLCDSKKQAIEKMRELAVKHASKNNELQYVEAEIYPEGWED